MRTIRIYCILFALSVAPVLRAQSFSSFILSGKADELAAGDLSFRTPDLALHKMKAELSFGKWAPQQLNYSALQAGVFMAVSPKLGFRLDYRNNLFPAFAQIDENGNESGTFKPGEQRILLGASLRVGESLYIDVNGKYLSTSLAGSKASAFAGDVAVNYVKDNLTVGIKGADIGSSYTLESTAYSLPMRVLAGASYRLAPAEGHRILLGADLGYILPSEYKAFTAAAGAEYAFNEMILVRAGYHFSSVVAPRFASFGLGFCFKGFGLDAAYLLGQEAGAWTVTLRYAF